MKILYGRTPGDLFEYGRDILPAVVWTIIFCYCLYGLFVGFPLAIRFALMLNELRSQKFKKSVQMITYMPHFISTVAVCGMVLPFLKKDTGVINAVISFFGGERKEWIAID